MQHTSFAAWMHSEKRCLFFQYYYKDVSVAGEEKERYVVTL